MTDHYEKKSDIPEGELNQFYRDPVTNEFIRIKPHPERPTTPPETEVEGLVNISEVAGEEGVKFGGAEGKAQDAANAAETSAPAVNIIK